MARLALFVKKAVGLKMHFICFSQGVTLFSGIPDVCRYKVLSWKHTRVRLRLRSRPRLRLRFGDKTHWVRHDLPVM